MGTQRFSAKETAAVLREIADALEAGKVGWWDLTVRATLVDVSTPGQPHFVESGKRDIEFRATVSQ